MSASASTLFTPRLVVRGGTRRAPARRAVPVARAGAHVPFIADTRIHGRVGTLHHLVCGLRPRVRVRRRPRRGPRASDAWFGWYFAPGGVVLRPGLIFTAFILGQALFEKLTGTGPKGKKKE